MPPVRRPGSVQRRAGRFAVPLAAATALLLAPSSAGADCSASLAPRGAGFTNAIVCAVTNLAVTPNPLDPGVVATFDGSGSTGANGPGDIATYAWDFGDGTQTTTDAIADPAGAHATTHAYAQRGHYVAFLATKDDTDTVIAVSAPVDVYVSAMPVAVLAVPPGTLRPGVAYSFDAGGSSAPGGSLDRYVFHWGDGTPDTTVQAPAAPAVQHTFAADATPAVSVTVVNDIGLQASSAPQTLTVHNQLPALQLAATPSTVTVGQQLTLSAAGSSDPDGSIAEYRWDLDANGSFETSTGTTTQVTAGGFPNDGPITLRMKAIDDSGGSSIRGVVVTVVDPASGSSGGGPGAGGSSGGGSARGSGDGSSGTGGGSGGSSSGSSGGSSAAGGTGNAFALGLSGAAIQRRATVLRHGVNLRALANRAATGKLTLTISPRDARALHLASRRTRKPVTIGSLRVRLRAGHAAKPAVKLTRKASRALRTSRRRALRVTITGALVAGHERTTARRIILLRR